MSANWLYQQPQPRLLSEVKDYIVFDTETTGLSPREERIIEISAIKVVGGQPVGKFSQLLNPGREISSFITSLTGIDNDLVNNAPPETEVIPQFIKFAGSLVVIGHNVNFDINFVNAACERMACQKLANQFIDTLQIARLLLPDLGHYKLENLVRHFALTNDSAHRAWADCQATRELFVKLSAYQQDNNIVLKKHKACTKAGN